MLAQRESGRTGEETGQPQKKLRTLRRCRDPAKVCRIIYELQSYLLLGRTKRITTLQTAASLLCDLLITTFLCAFLKSQKGDVEKCANLSAVKKWFSSAPMWPPIYSTNYMMDMVIHETGSKRQNNGKNWSVRNGVTFCEMCEAIQHFTLGT
ncbi:hypothetical protein K438DRAFT_1760006 [Mycena galopus ATCC 62051]|nr:hypothetical protein K438DRAFT_1760006 [Mycena galopus ATCC 62051]